MTTKETDFTSLVGAELAGALERKGFKTLTSVQEAVLAPELAGRDLRITSQTGSGKTVAIGLAIRAVIERESAAAGGIARPRALVVAPTRELAKQVEEELSWLYAPLRARVAAVTGGASYRDERRALGAGPAVIVGTPGRLLDHLKRGGIDATQIGAVVLDEADRMLDLGFKEDIEAILGFAPAERATHLVSATFPRDVRALADKVQRTPAHVEGTRLGVANVDIDHVIHLVDVRQRVDAIVNLLLATPEAQTLVFARTRAEVARITRELSEAGFQVSSLSGEMEQPERNRALAGFKSGRLHALIATDVAARGIDVQDIARVIHAEPPDDADAYTHRSGRTGRAGRKGTSSVLVSQAGLHRATQLLKRAGVHPRVEPIPSASEIRAAADERIFVELTRDAAEGTGVEEAIDPRTMALAERLASEGHATRSLARLLSRGRHGGATGPREIRRVEPPSVHEPRAHSRSHDAPPSSAPRANTRRSPRRVGRVSRHVGPRARRRRAPPARRRLSSRRNPRHRRRRDPHRSPPFDRRRRTRRIASVRARRRRARPARAQRRHPPGASRRGRERRRPRRLPEQRRGYQQQDRRRAASQARTSRVSPEALARRRRTSHAHAARGQSALALTLSSPLA